jgi:hypothetical protein
MYLTYRFIFIFECIHLNMNNFFQGYILMNISDLFFYYLYFLIYYYCRMYLKILLMREVFFNIFYNSFYIFDSHLDLKMLYSMDYLHFYLNFTSEKFEYFVILQFSIGIFIFNNKIN